VSQTVVWRGFVDDAGHIALLEKANFREWVQRYRGRHVSLTVRLSRLQARHAMRYYRGVVIPDLAAAADYDVRAMHNAAAWKFLSLPAGKFGEPRRRSTGELGPTELREYIDAVVAWGEAEFACHVRRPTDVELATVTDRPDWQ